MADKANITGYLDDATTQKTFKPYESLNTQKQREETWRESSNTLASVLRGKVTYAAQELKDGTVRRMVKVSLPSAETPASFGADPNGYTPDAKVNYTLEPYVVIPVPPLATDTDVANALRMLVNVLLDDAAAGTANAYRDATGAGREFLVHGFMPD